MHFSLQAIGHDPVRLGHPWESGGFYAKDQQAQSVTHSLTYLPEGRAGSISNFGVCFALPSGSTPPPVLGFGHCVVVRGRMKERERCSFWPPRPAVTEFINPAISGHWQVFLPPTSRS